LAWITPSYVKPLDKFQSVTDRDATEGSTDTPQIERSSSFVDKTNEFGLTRTPVALA